jgi:hypothetical protein
MVTISSALSSSSEDLMRFSSSESGAGATAFFALALALPEFFAGFFAAFRTAGTFLALFLAVGFLAVFLAAFFAGLRVSSSVYGANLAWPRGPHQGF